MRKVAGLVVVVVVVLGVAGFAFLHSVTANGQPTSAKTGQPASAKSGQPASVKVAKVATSTKTYSMKAGGLTRSYVVIAPDKALPKSAPVIIALSGYGATVPEEVARDELTPYVSADEAELVYPVAVKASWDAIGCCGYANTHKVNDLAFLEALVPKVDPGHARPVYVMGFSNGARLAYRVACTDPTLFDAYAMVKGVPLPGCTVSKPVTLLEIASVNDDEIPYKPGDGGLEPLPVTTEVARLHASDECPAPSVVTHSLDMTLTTWSGCADGTRLAFAVWPEGKHLFPRPPITKQAAAPVIWSFFTKTPLAPLP
jgi:polyhydroxybutyrate depolymerase